MKLLTGANLGNDVENEKVLKMKEFEESKVVKKKEDDEEAGFHNLILCLAFF